jgi:hypothetical protein
MVGLGGVGIRGIAGAVGVAWRLDHGSCVNNSGTTAGSRHLRSDLGQGYLGLLAALVLVGVLTVVEFGGGGGGTSGIGGTGTNSGGGGGGGGGYSATIGAAKSAASNAGKPDAYSGANSGLIPTTTVMTDPPVSYAPASKGPGALTKRSVVTLGNQVVTLAQSLAGPGSIDAIDPAVGKSYLSVAFADIASSSGAVLTATGGGWNVVSGDGRLAACISVSGTTAVVHGGRCS